MKSFIKIITSLLFVTILIFSCSEENDSNLNHGKNNFDTMLKDSYNLGLMEYYNNDLIIDDYGLLHNIGLNNILTNQPNYIFTDFDKLISDISIELNKTHPNKFYRLASNYEIDDSILTNNNSTFENFILDQTNTLKSENVKELIVEIVVNKLNFDDASILANDYLTKRNLKQPEIDEIKLFLSVASLSNEFWNNYYTLFKNNDLITGSKTPCDPKDQVYKADAFGFLCWGGLGGIGYSWFMDEAQDQNGGGCL